MAGQDPGLAEDKYAHQFKLECNFTTLSCPASYAEKWIRLVEEDLIENRELFLGTSKRAEGRAKDIVMIDVKIKQTLSKEQQEELSLAFDTLLDQAGLRIFERGRPFKSIIVIVVPKELYTNPVTKEAHERRDEVWSDAGREWVPKHSPSLKRAPPLDRYDTN